MRTKSVLGGFANRQRGVVPDTLGERSSLSGLTDFALFDNEKLMTVNELALRLNCSRAHIYTLKSEHGLPFVKLGRSLKFRWKDVERWLSERSCA